MKRLSKMFLVAGLILFGLSGFTACSNGSSSSSGGDTEKEKGKDSGGGGGSGAVDEIEVDFRQTTIPASAYTYPEKVDHAVHPKASDLPYVDASFVDSSKNVPELVTKGTDVKSQKNLITVTPQSNGLLVQVNYQVDYSNVIENVTVASNEWKHVSLKVANLTDNTGAIEVSELSITDDTSEGTRTSEFLYKFTESGKKYKVWLTHQGNTSSAYGFWGTTEKDEYVEVTSIGGYGNINSTASDMKIELDANENRVVSVNNLVITGPANVFTNPASIPQSIKVRAEKGARWSANYCDANAFFPVTNNQFTIAYWDAADSYAKGEIDKLKTYINGAENLFIVLTYRFDFDGKEYKHDCYSNYDKWISDYKEPLSVPDHKFPLIKIKSTKNGGTNYFVTEPIAHHVKDENLGWATPEEAEYLKETPDPWYEECTIGVEDPKNKYNLDPVEGEVKVRGNWTTSYDKKSLRIRFKKDTKYNLCGLNVGKEFRNWVLLAVWKDASFLRDATGFYLYKEMFSDYYASDSKLVEVEVNGEYMGVYLLAEQQEVKKKRVNITDTDDSTGTDIGYFIEFDKYYTSEKENERFEINYGKDIKDYNGKVLDNPQKGYTIKSDINNAAQKEFIMKYMNRLWRICYEAVYNKKYYKFTDGLTLAAYTPEGDTDDKKCENCISEIIDVKSLADMYIFNELVCDPDIYLTSFLMDVDFGEGADRKLRFEAPWDFDSTMGNKRFCTDAASSGVYVGKNDMFAGACQTDVNCKDERIHANPWMVIFIRQGWFQKLVKDEWKSLGAETVSAGVASYIDAFSASEYEEVFNYTRNKWGTAVDNSELCPASKTATATSQKASADYLKTWITDRFTAVGTIIEGLTTN